MRRTRRREPISRSRRFRSPLGPDGGGALSGRILALIPPLLRIDEHAEIEAARGEKSVEAAPAAWTAEASAPRALIQRPARRAPEECSPSHRRPHLASTQSAEFHARISTPIARLSVRSAARSADAAIPLGERPVEASAQEALETLLNALRDSGPPIMTWSDSARSLRSRIGALHGVNPQLWPDVSDEALIASTPVWLAAELDSLASGAPLASVDMAAAIRSLLDWSTLRRLDALAPSEIEIPTGARRRIDWSSGHPVLALRVQEAFGWIDTPAFADGHLPLVLHLTDPAGRPAAVTSDLASFWTGPYQQVRAQLRGRYPKHPWPEDPFTERPTSRAKPRP
ncbi:HrpA-like RNA helicase [Schaalia hyovaginalis]|uniref:HrpA-like RNA helicase n=2 Tax=Schaalia hyovaginalis TaxID=29316 RepID=A0A923E569_9ACTO|nr:HrpA-like RNA helicase [Schaalia hyovaginalis]